MNTLRRATFVLLALALLLVSPARATSFSTDQSDLYYNASEPGWGMQVVQRGSLIFATIFVYDQSTAPIWYTATLYATATPYVFSGDLYLTTGPWFGTVPFDPNAVGYRKVGTMTWAGQTVDAAVLTYVVDGVTVTKNVVRQFLVFDNFSGHYFGGAHRDVTDCVNPSFNGTTEVAGTVAVVQNGQAVTIQSSNTAGGSCTYSGTLSQAGQMGRIPAASFVCTDGSVGTITFFEMQVNISGLTARFNSSYSSPPGCQGTGWMGGMRGTTF